MHRLLRTTIAEIDRDHRLLVLALLRQLADLSTEQLTLALASGRVDDPDDLWRRIEDLLATSRLRYRELNNARILRRATPSRAAGPQPPRPLRDFARNGPYAGAYADLRDLARAALGDLTLPPALADHLDLDALGLELHLRGALWTLAHDGKIHAFRVRPSAPDPADPAGPAPRPTADPPPRAPAPDRPDRPAAARPRRKRSRRKR